MPSFSLIKWGGRESGIFGYFSYSVVSCKCATPPPAPTPNTFRIVSVSRYTLHELTTQILPLSPWKQLLQLVHVLVSYCYSLLCSFSPSNGAEIKCPHGSCWSVVVITQKISWSHKHAPFPVYPMEKGGIFTGFLGYILSWNKMSCTTKSQ